MNPITKIAVALDLSPESERLITEARRIFGLETELYLLYSGQELSANHYKLLAEMLPESPDDLACRVRTQDRTRLRAMGKQFAVPLDRQRLLDGKPEEAITTFLEEHDIELLVLGNHHHRYLDQWSHPLTDRLRRNSHCHLLLIDLETITPSSGAD